MINRNTLAVIALVATGATAPAFADDGDVRHAKNLLEEARTFGKTGVTGQAAGQVERTRTDSETRDANEQRWREISRSQALN